MRLVASLSLALLLTSGCLSLQDPGQRAASCTQSQIDADVPGLYDHLKAHAADGVELLDPTGAPIDLHGVDPTLGNTTVKFLHWHADGRQWTASDDEVVSIRTDGNGTRQVSGDPGPTFQATLFDGGLDIYTDKYAAGAEEQMRSDFLRMLSLVADVDPAEAARAADRLVEPFQPSGAHQPAHRVHADVLSWKVDALWRSYNHETPDRVWDTLAAGPWRFDFSFERAKAVGDGWTLRVDERGDLGYTLFTQGHLDRSGALQRLNATLQSWAFERPVPSPAIEQHESAFVCEHLTPSPTESST